VGTARASWIVADHARLIRAEHPLASGTNGLGSPGNGETDGRSGAVTRPYEDVPGLGAQSKVVIDQTGLGGGSRARINAAHSGQLRREAHAGIGDGIGDRGGVKHAQGGNCRGLIRAHSRAEKNGDRNRRNNENHGNDDQQLNERESFLSPHKSNSPTTGYSRRTLLRDKVANRSV